MARAIVTITETHERAVTVKDVVQLSEALKSVQDKYYNEEIVLDSSDYAGVMFFIEMEEEE